MNPPNHHYIVSMKKEDIALRFTYEASGYRLLVSTETHHVLHCEISQDILDKEELYQLYGDRLPPLPYKKSA